MHRKAVLAELLPEQQPIAEQVLKGGIPAVRQAIDAENEKRAAAGEPPINATELLGVAEQLLPRLRTADWRDRAEAALNESGDLDLRDLRSVVVASDVAARDDETRALAADLRKPSSRSGSRPSTPPGSRTSASPSPPAGSCGRCACRRRPPKAGTMLPVELRAQLLTAAGEALTADVGADRWAAVLDATAYAPVRTEVKPASVPETPSDDLLAAIRKYASRVPAVAAAFGIEVSAARPARGPVDAPAEAPPPPRHRPGPAPPRRPHGHRRPGRRRPPAPVAESATGDGAGPGRTGRARGPSPRSARRSTDEPPAESRRRRRLPRPHRSSPSRVAPVAEPTETAPAPTAPVEPEPSRPRFGAGRRRGRSRHPGRGDERASPSPSRPPSPRGMPSDATPVAPSGSTDEGAAEALEAAPDLDELSDGEPAP